MSKFVQALSFALFFAPGITTAQVVISEIMYDLEGSDTGREWVEVFNTGSTPVPLTEWKLFEADSNHNIIAYSGGESLPGGAYAIIADNPAKFLVDRPTYTDALFDSSFSLSNTGETLTLRCCSTDENLIDKDSVFYDPGIGAAGDGNTLHRASTQSSSFAAAAPTPGTGSLQKTGGGNNSVPAFDTDGVAVEAPESNSSSAGTVSSSSAVLARVSAGSNRTVIAGIEAQLEASAYDGSNRPVEAEFRWNFGDGATALGRSVSHKWEYAGRYAVVLEAVRYGEKASHRITVSVEFPELSFKALPDGGVIIENLSNRELDLSGWRIAERGMTFVFPQNTIVLRGASIRLSSTNIGFFASASITLLYPNGTVFSTGTPDVTEEGALTPALAETTFVDTSAIEPTLENRLEPDSALIEDVEPDIVQEKTEEETPPPQDQAGQRSEQLAAAAAAGVGSNMSLLWWLGALLLLALAGVAVYAARRLGRREWAIIEDTSE